jgi:hypothetical protein
MTAPRSRHQRVIDFHAQNVMLALAKAGPWERACPDCDAPPREVCFPWCGRFKEDPE